MFDVFSSYLSLGFQHIVDFNGFDHILFIITLCAVYRLTEWRKIAIVITAFTLGHSITLVMASLKFILPNRYLIELFIPLTILVSAVYNLISEKFNIKNEKIVVKYSFALLFGLIHGMSFSSFFSDIMGDASQILFPLFSFNVGIEFGQFFIISVFYTLLYLFYLLFKIPYKWVVRLFSLLSIIVSIILIFKRI